MATRVEPYPVKKICLYRTFFAKKHAKLGSKILNFVI